MVTTPAKIDNISFYDKTFSIFIEVNFIPIKNISIAISNPFKKGKKLYSILHLKCPKCHEGNIFVYKNPYNLSKIDKMPMKCVVCGEDFYRETGFYYGAMMISHATTTVIAVLVHLTVYHFYGWEIAPNIITLLIILIGSFPIIFRSSRAIWINFFVNYDPTFKK